MNILMLTNTFTPHVGGVARSVEGFVEEYRRRGHRVLVVAPQFEGTPADEVDVVRIPALQKFNGSDFSVRMPIPGFLTTTLESFRPEIVHAHHPFLLGDTAVRIAAGWKIPLVFTHHTMYERYTHYVPLNSEGMARFAIKLATGYANLCDCVFAPSESVATVLQDRGVEAPVEVVPTGIDVERFARGDGLTVRAALGIPKGAYVVGHVGRLAPEKNLAFLALAVADFMKRRREVHFLVVGSGPSEAELIARCEAAGVRARLHLAGSRSGQALVDAYRAMDCFAFASQTETQGLVLIEAMAAGLPVVAVDASGAREVVRDRVNGRLLPHESQRQFVAALEWLRGRDAPGRRDLVAAARKTAEEFSTAACADRALGHYARLIGVGAAARRSDESAWETALNWWENEWELWANIATSAGSALQRPSVWRLPGVGLVVRGWRRLRRWFDRGEWDVRLLGLPTSEGTAAEPGLVMVQIDGLSRRQFEYALAKRRLPFLRSLLRKHDYRVADLYSGLPSSTPAVQGELFYGVKGAVPSFGFRDGRSGRLVRMFDAGPASTIEAALAAEGQPLLAGGSAYADIYTGGAAEPHFCAAAMGFGSLLRYANPLGMTLFFLWHMGSLLKLVALMGLELVLALIDVVNGVSRGRSLYKELKFIPSRVFVSIFLRDFVSIGAAADAARGVGVIHLNLLGYDEQAHRRGPGSTFAHRSLKGIDRAIRRVWFAARRSRRRRYQLWIYSDHGQEHTVPYRRLTGLWIEEAVAKVFERPVIESVKGEGVLGEGVEHRRAAWLRPAKEAAASEGPGGALLVSAVGPLGHVYPAVETNADQRCCRAEQLVREAAIPLVFTTDAAGGLWAFSPQGRFAFPQQADEVVPRSHPFFDAIIADLESVCRHPDAGMWVISGWRADDQPISFAHENGAHAGPGPEETSGVVVIPAGAWLPKTSRGYLRPLDLRRAAFHAMGKGPPAGKKAATPTAAIAPPTPSMATAAAANAGQPVPGPSR